MDVKISNHRRILFTVSQIRLCASLDGLMKFAYMLGAVCYLLRHLISRGQWATKERESEQATVINSHARQLRLLVLLPGQKNIYTHGNSFKRVKSSG